MRDLNARHPWSHNDHFHSWIVTRLPSQRHRAIDVGCGRGELLAVLATQFDQVHGIDSDAQMREAATARCAGLTNVSVNAETLADVAGQVDVVTLVAVLHHLEVEQALGEIRRILAPGGRFLCVGLARPASPTDHAWDIASLVTNPVIGYVKHPWVSTGSAQQAAIAVKDPQLTYDEVRTVVQRVMPGAQLRRRLGFRHTIEWTKPV
jgi:ubiquinone/menaquinone biosynthesis C-methylase UbiE